MFSHECILYEISNFMFMHELVKLDTLCLVMMNIYEIMKMTFSFELDKLYVYS